MLGGGSSHLVASLTSFSDREGRKPLDRFVPSPSAPPLTGKRLRKPDSQSLSVAFCSDYSAIAAFCLLLWKVIRFYALLICCRDNSEKVLVHAEMKEKPIDLVLTTPSEVTETTIEASEVKGFTSKLEVQETCNVGESRALNKEIKHEITYRKLGKLMNKLYLILPVRNELWLSSDLAWLASSNGI
ncbi:hypothetical protein Cgig2_018841 [Carnegiea gigantea]|uniref:Uncharacterized protein n=1 Tax=Carnegiea gigantea TaxID=171969 RepID=A0A9Q1GGV7_9CARY|nr:hypothetical protein Cgig2_018841 [Carnegiea gigantea]